MPVHRKQSLYFPSKMLRDIEREAARTDRSLSWIVQRCIRSSLDEVKRLPSTRSSPPPAAEEVETDGQDARLGGQGV